MTRKLQIKQIMAIALSIIMVLGLVPMTVFADGTYTFPSYSQSGNNNSTLRYYLTDENAGSITVNQSSNHPTLNLNIDDGWYFEKWDTYFDGYEDKAILSDPEVKGSNLVGEDGYYTFYNIHEKQPFSNSRTFLYISTSTNFYGDHKVTAVLKPILTVNADDGVSYEVTTNNPTKVSSNQTAVKYQDDVTITYTVDDKYVLTDVNASGTKTINIDKENNRVVLSGTEKPTSVGIHARLKQQNVAFDANGGEGTMSTQVFEHSVAQTLTANNFTRSGYTFAGWNTKSDGSGTSYTDGQSVSFAPANDGDIITLYAQWTACTNHQWEDGECTQCGALCSHSGGTATCNEKAVCSACGQSYGKTLGHDWGNWISNNDGTHTRTCSNDASHTETNDCSGGTATCTAKAVCTACGEKYGNFAKHTYGDATCEAPAICSGCGTPTGNALGHKDDNTDHTCDRDCGKTDMGIHAAASGKHTCDYCGNAVTTCTDFADVVKPEALKSAADCTNPAVYFKSCTVCGANGTETFTSGEAKGHTYDEGVVTTKPGCETEGIKTFTCTCGHSYTEPVSATGHTYTTAVTAPSCTEKGYTTYTCACGDSYVGDEVAATGHSFTEYKANGDVTCTADGTKTAKCDNCEATDTAADTGSKKAHTYEKGKCTVCEAVDPDYVPETDSPQTGDNSNMVLWFALLFISGGALLALTVYNRKRKTYLR